MESGFAGLLSGVGLTIILGLIFGGSCGSEDVYRSRLIGYGVAGYDAKTGDFIKHDPARVSCSIRGAVR